MQELINGFGNIAIYFIICATVALLLRFMIKIPNEIFRKLLHFILLGSLLVFVFGFATWYAAVSASLIFAAVVYPILWLCEKFKAYSEITTERKKGELKTSLLLVFGMFALVMAVCWGLLDDKQLVLASVYAWGFGDAFAALIGKRFGKHKIEWKHINGKKSWEGTIAMFWVSFISVMIILVLRGGLGMADYMIISVMTAFISAAVELYTPNGMDTVTCPLAAMAVLLPLIWLLGGIG